MTQVRILIVTLIVCSLAWGQRPPSPVLRERARNQARQDLMSDLKVSKPPGVTIVVNCDRKNGMNSITKALERLDPLGPSTLKVSGTCNENVVIASFDRLALVANPVATITDASGGVNPTLTIVDSQRIDIQGFTINGGSTGVACGNNSLCRFSGNTIQGALGDGINLSRAHADFYGDVIQNNGRGLAIVNDSRALGAPVTVQGDLSDGVAVIHSFFYTYGGSVIGNNAGEGIVVNFGGNLRLDDATVTGNGDAGVFVRGNSIARIGSFAPDTITGNFGAGIDVGDLSFASFIDGDTVVSNNLGGYTFDVACNPQYPSTRGALTNTGGGTTNCVEP